MTSKTAKTAKISQTPRDLSMTKTPSQDISDTIKKRFIEIYSSDEVRGNVSIACDAVNIARSTYYVWLEQDEEFRKATKEAKLRLCDDMEQVLVSRAVDSSDTALIFWLKNNHDVYREKGNTFNTQVNIGLPSWAKDES